MPSKTALTLRCEDCGHEWTARNTQGKARQCSKCRSRRIGVRDAQDIALTEDVAPLIRKNGSDPPALTEDLEIRDKLKERSASLTAEEPSQMSAVLSRMIAQHKTLLRSLYKSGLLGYADHKWQTCMCPWCGSSKMRDVEIKLYTWG